MDHGRSFQPIRERTYDTAAAIQPLTSDSHGNFWSSDQVSWVLPDPEQANELVEALR